MMSDSASVVGSNVGHPYGVHNPSTFNQSMRVSSMSHYPPIHQFPIAPAPVVPTQSSGQFGIPSGSFCFSSRNESRQRPPSQATLMQAISEADDGDAEELISLSNIRTESSRKENASHSKRNEPHSSSSGYVSGEGRKRPKPTHISDSESEESGESLFLCIVYSHRVVRGARILEYGIWMGKISHSPLTVQSLPRFADYP